MARGYYTRTVIAAWDWRNGAFTRRWTFDTNSSTNSGKGFDGQGSHSLSVGDVDGDGRDEIVYGAMAVDDNGGGLWTTKTGHGDAQHLADLDPRTRDSSTSRSPSPRASPPSCTSTRRTAP